MNNAISLLSNSSLSNLGRQISQPRLALPSVTDGFSGSSAAAPTLIKPTMISGPALVGKSILATIGGGVGFAMGAAATAVASAVHPIAGAVVGAIFTAPTAAVILSPLGNGKGGEGLVYPIAGLFFGAIGGAVAGAIGGPATPWIFTALGVTAGIGPGR